MLKASACDLKANDERDVSTWISIHCSTPSPQFLATFPFIPVLTCTMSTSKSDFKVLIVGAGEAKRT